ncbi:kinase-like domain-containing protein [Scenedesmus sp. NREL 46B-D3]|nr:kinase-like domain-containing protein [Scenedesmus sp. NREL 46B-D3]
MSHAITHLLHGDLAFKTSACLHTTMAPKPYPVAVPHSLLRLQPCQHASDVFPGSKSWPANRHHAPLLAAAAACESCCSAAPQLGWNAGFTNKFAVGQVLGRGSFGTVHEAVHKMTGNCYAVKVLKKAGSHGGMQLDAISREVSTWVQAQGSKFVAKLEGLYEDEEHAYIVQELCAGGDLKTLLDANGCVSEVEAATIMRGVLDMLVELHSKSICYADLKPANIMFSGGSECPASPFAHLQVRAVDFGSSRVAAKGRALTHCCGSPLYMAPEMLLQRFGVGVDVWAAGVMMYQMLTGRLPFWRSKSLGDVSRLQPYEILAAIRTHEVQFPRELWAPISAEAQALVAGMLDRDPATRTTAQQALAHPWLSGALGYTPTPSGACAAGNVVGLPPQGLPRSRPVDVPQLSTGRQQAAGGGGGALLPSRGSRSPAASRRTLSGELPLSCLLPELRAHAQPVLVPAAE